MSKPTKRPVLVTRDLELTELDRYESSLLGRMADRRKRALDSAGRPHLEVIAAKTTPRGGMKCVNQYW